MTQRIVRDIVSLLPINRSVVMPIYQELCASQPVYVIENANRTVSRNEAAKKTSFPIGLE